LWIKEQSDAFFPVKVDYSSLPADPRELEDKLLRFKDAARVSWKKLTCVKWIALEVSGTESVVGIRNFKDLKLQLKLVTPPPYFIFLLCFKPLISRTIGSLAKVNCAA